MTPSLAYRDGWLAHRNQRRMNPYCEFDQYASYLEWERGLSDRASKGDDPYLEILDQEMMGE